MRGKELFHTSLSYLNRLYKWKWGYVVTSLSIAMIVFLLGLLDRQQSIWDLLFTAFLYGPLITGVAFLIKKYGWEGFATKTIEITIRIILGIASLCVRPIQKLWNAYLKPVAIVLAFPFILAWKLIYTWPKWLLFTKIPDLLPFVLRPLYKFCWSLLFASAVYYGFWVLFSIAPQPGDFMDIKILNNTYHVVITGAQLAGVILGIALLDFIPAYFGMFWRWLDRFQCQIRFVIHH